jgi:nicotinate-nucleotide--dimethylbenzimidazole phosphoribosyltransferase
MTSLSPLSSVAAFRQIVQDLPDVDETTVAAVGVRERALLKPPGALGRLETLTAWLAGWQGRHPPRLGHVWALVFAGSHGVVDRGVSAYPPEVTRQMIAGFHQGYAAVNQLCAAERVDLEVFPLEPDRATRDFTREPAMDEEELLAALNVGFLAADRGADLLCLGEMGIGNTTAAAALAHALHGGLPRAWTGPGTGLDADRLARKESVVGEAVALHRPLATDAIDLLRRLGGRELAAIAGVVIGARLCRVPVILDGYTATAAAAVLAAQAPGALDHCQVGHRSAEPGHTLLLRTLGMTPLLDLGMRLGEASGAVLAVALVRAALACHTGMATFAEAGVSGPSD